MDTSVRSGTGRRIGGLVAVGALVAVIGIGGGKHASASEAAAAAAPTPAAVSAAPTPAAAATPTPTPTPTPAAVAPSPAVSAVASSGVPVTALGRSQVLSPGEQTAKVGALFASDSITPGNHFCTASVVDSPAGNVIVTAAHCLSAGGTGAVFVPGYHDGTAPDGVWKISQVIEGSAWTGQGSQDDDVAFALVSPQNGRSLQSTVGGYELSTAGTTSGTVQLTGYPSATDRPITCTGSASAFSATQLTVYCTAFTGGTSGTAWLAGYDQAADTGAIIGVIGGYQQGGDSPDTSYSIVFGPAVRQLYQQAVAG